MLSGLSEIPTNHFFIQIRLHFIHSFISTHPRRVWLYVDTLQFTPGAVSIHTPTKGVTNPFSVIKTFSLVSIHTPTKGVTRTGLADSCTDRFNPHTHEGCDLKILEEKFTAISFNPHTHEGCDLALGCPRYCPPSFNPHTHEGCDFTRHINKSSEDWVSIHTPTKGVTFASISLKT